MVFDCYVSDNTGFISANVHDSTVSLLKSYACLRNSLDNVHGHKDVKKYFQVFILTIWAFKY